MSKFITSQSTVTSTDETVYTSPEKSPSIMISGFIANKNSDSPAYVTLSYKSDDGITILIPSAPVPANSTYMFDCKLVIKEGASITAYTDNTTSGYVDLTLSYLLINE